MWLEGNVIICSIVTVCVKKLKQKWKFARQCAIKHDAKNNIFPQAQQFSARVMQKSSIYKELQSICGSVLANDLLIYLLNFPLYIEDLKFGKTILIRNLVIYVYISESQQICYHIIYEWEGREMRGPEVIVLTKKSA